jgi:hypothetical protein
MKGDALKQSKKVGVTVYGWGYTVKGNLLIGAFVFYLIYETTNFA